MPPITMSMSFTAAPLDCVTIEASGDGKRGRAPPPRRRCSARCRDPTSVYSLSRSVAGAAVPIAHRLGQALRCGGNWRERPLQVVATGILTVEHGLAEAGPVLRDTTLDLPKRAVVRCAVPDRCIEIWTREHHVGALQRTDHSAHAAPTGCTRRCRTILRSGPNPKRSASTLRPRYARSPQPPQRGSPRIHQRSECWPPSTCRQDQ